MDWRHAGLLLMLLGCTAVAHADYAAGRLSALAGTVYVQTPGDPDSHPAVVNEVLAEGDQVATWEGAGAELQFADAVLQLGANTVIALTRVDSDQLVGYVVQGTVAAARLPHRGSAALTLQGSHVVAALLTAGRMRLSVWPDSRQEWLSVRQGRVAAEADQNSLTLYAGQGLQTYVSAGGLATALTAGEAVDLLDDAVLAADQQLRHAVSVARLGGDWIGAASLDGQGDWLEVSSVGPLWVPMFLPAGWAPYRGGHWQWNAVWGWTWIDDLPWCWMPYHYGRWIWWNNRWAWSPSGRRPVFSPAVVPPPGIVLPPLPGPWQPGGRVALSSRATVVPRAMPAARGGGARALPARPAELRPLTAPAPSLPPPPALAALAPHPGHRLETAPERRAFREPPPPPPMVPAAAMPAPLPRVPATTSPAPARPPMLRLAPAVGPAVAPAPAPVPAPALSAAPRPAGVPPGSRPNASAGASRRPEKGS